MAEVESPETKLARIDERQKDMLIRLKKVEECQDAYTMTQIATLKTQKAQFLTLVIACLGIIATLIVVVAK